MPFQPRHRPAQGLLVAFPSNTNQTTRIHWLQDHEPADIHPVLKANCIILRREIGAKCQSLACKSDPRQQWLALRAWEIFPASDVPIAVDRCLSSEESRGVLHPPSFTNWLRKCMSLASVPPAKPRRQVSLMRDSDFKVPPL